MIMRVRSLTALLVFTCAASVGPLTASAQNLIQVWQAALGNDSTYAAARVNYRAGLEKEPQARALLLPLITAEAGGAYQETRSTRGLSYAYSGGRGVWDLALTQPLRLEDAVVIDKEWGWVEEINSTYIVVRLWDWRRLVVPLSYLFQNPFANWTRNSSSIIGTVYVYADYTLPMDAARARATAIVKASPLWDGQVVNVQVSDARQQVMEVRVLASAGDSSRAWDLRCEIREKLIAWIRERHPESLPRVRREDFRLADAGAREPAQPH